MSDSFEKVGRLKPDEFHDTIRVIQDDRGKIEIISRERMEAIVAEVEPVISSSSGSTVSIELLVGEQMIMVL